MWNRNKQPNYEKMRKLMVEKQLVPRHISDPKVLAAMESVPRHRFVHESLRKQAYDDRPLPIGLDQTISQPYMVAAMTQLLQLKGDEKVLEIGTGSGYQTAILAEIVDEIYSIERHEKLASWASYLLEEMNYENVTVYHGDGTHGLPQEAPYDIILVAATGPTIPQTYRDQLAIGGRLVLPVERDGEQFLYRITRHEDDFDDQKIMAVRFVPLIGDYGYVDQDNQSDS